MRRIKYLLTFSLLILLFASCKKNSESTPPPPDLPVINSFSPLSGSEGTIVTINGANFSSTAANDLVNFNGIIATVMSATVNKMTVTVPNGASTGKITVTISTHTGTSTNDFTVLPAAFTIARSGIAATALGNKIYFGGGYDGTLAIGNVDIYDVDSAKWSLAKLSLPRFNFAAASAGHKVVFAGGETDAVLPAPLSAVVDIYDDSTKTWSTAHLSQPSYLLSAGSALNTIIFGGGVVDTGISSSVDIYNTVNNTWTTHSLIKGKAYATIIGTGNKILIAGGLNLDSTTTNLNYFFKSVDIYNAVTDSWSQASLSVGRGGMGVAAAGGKIVFAGGYTKDTAYNAVLSSVVDIYDVVSGTWSTSLLAVPADYSCAAASGNKILFVRDSDAPGYSNGVVDVYDVTTNSWTLSSLTEARMQIAAAGANNKIAFAGGWSQNSGFSKTVDIYNVTTGGWSH